MKNYDFCSLHTFRDGGVSVCGPIFHSSLSSTLAISTWKGKRFFIKLLLAALRLCLHSFFSCIFAGRSRWSLLFFFFSSPPIAFAVCASEVCKNSEKICCLRGRYLIAYFGDFDFYPGIEKQMPGAGSLRAVQWPFCEFRKIGKIEKSEISKCLKRKIRQSFSFSLLFYSRSRQSRFASLLHHPARRFFTSRLFWWTSIFIFLLFPFPFRFIFTERGKSRDVIFCAASPALPRESR